MNDDEYGVFKGKGGYKGRGYRGGGGGKGVYNIYNEHVHYATIDVHAPMISPLIIAIAINNWSLIIFIILGHIIVYDLI